jgi:hypothetical protein
VESATIAREYVYEIDRALALASSIIEIGPCSRAPASPAIDNDPTVGAGNLYP